MLEWSTQFCPVSNFPCEFLTYSLLDWFRIYTTYIWTSFCVPFPILTHMLERQKNRWPVTTSKIRLFNLCQLMCLSEYQVRFSLWVLSFPARRRRNVPLCTYGIQGGSRFRIHFNLAKLSYLLQVLVQHLIHIHHHNNPLRKNAKILLTHKPITLYCPPSYLQRYSMHTVLCTFCCCKRKVI